MPTNKPFHLLSKEALEAQEQGVLEAQELGELKFKKQVSKLFEQTIIVSQAQAESTREFYKRKPLEDVSFTNVKRGKSELERYSEFENRDEQALSDAKAVMDDVAKYPAWYSTKQTVRFIRRPINLGNPETLPYSGRGPRPKRTQYDFAKQRRKDLYYKLEGLSLSRQLAAKSRLRVGNITLRKIETLAEQLRLRETPQRQRVSKLLFEHHGKERDFQLTLKV